MRAHLGGSGINLGFTEKDKPVLVSGGILEARFPEFLKPRIRVHICDVVERKDTDFLCESGFRVETKPYGPPEKRRFYEIWLSKQNASKLIANEYWGSRSKIDRVEMVYWDLSSNC
jgi:hypothetical protein